MKANPVDNWQGEPPAAGNGGGISPLLPNSTLDSAYAHLPSDLPENTEVINRRDERHFRRADAHSGAVVWLKRLLPVVAVALVAVIGVAIVVFQYRLPGEVTVSGVGISDGKLVMDQPTMNGFDRQNRPFDVKAVRAIQDLNDPGVITLENIKAQLPMSAEDFAQVIAKTGVYDTKKEWLSLSDNITVEGKDGLIINLLTAEIDLKTGILISKDPVEVNSGSTSLRADTLKVTKNGDTVVFEKRVIMVIVPGEGKPKQ